MKHAMMTGAFAALLALPFAASAQNAPKADGPAANSGIAMNCPMTAGMPGMQKDMGGVMSDMEAILKDTKEPAMKERMQRMHDHMSAMMVSMQKMRAMGMMMGEQQTGKTTSEKQETSPSTAVSPEDHATHHPAQ